MQGYLAIVLHAHLPFVRHPEHEKSLEETWLFESISECYLPLLQVLEGWWRDGVPARLTLSLSPTLCAMLQDELLRDRYRRHLDGLISLAEKEVLRTSWDRPTHELACLYRERFVTLRRHYLDCGADLLAAFRTYQDHGLLEIITCAATHAVLPLMADHPPSVRAQVLVARDHHRACFGCEPRGLWLPECAYFPGLETVLHEAGILWFILDTHGLLHAQPRPRYRIFAPVLTSAGPAAFGRDLNSARQVWSRHEGYPGDGRYRDFYRDIAFDLDLDYLKPHLPDPRTRTFTGIKYHRITGGTARKEIYRRAEALQAAAEHAAHFLEARLRLIRRLAGLMDRPPLLVAPYDAELFGHWWHEGTEFLDQFARQAASARETLTLITPTDYLRRHPDQQVSTPAASSWGEGGHLQVWLNEKNAWMQPHLRVAQQRMSELARRHPQAGGITGRALQQAARELLLAQASDWPFILTSGTSPGYARDRFNEHIACCLLLHEQISAGAVDEAKLRDLERRDNLFPSVDYHYWA